MELFDGITNRLSAETRRKAIEYKINVLGFDLTHAQQRGFEAAIAILTRNGFRSRRVRLGLDQWHADYGVVKKESARGKIESSQFSRLQSLNVLRELATIPWLIYYEKQVAPDQWQVVEEIAPLWTLKVGYELSETERARFYGGDLGEEILNKLRVIEINFNDVWFDQHANHYFWKPGNLLQQMTLALHGKRPPDHLNNFITWILSEAEMKRRRGLPPVLMISLEELAHKCRLTADLRYGNRSRILTALTRNAQVAQKVNLLQSFNFDDPRNLTVTCSDKVFAEAQAWASRRRPDNKKKRAPASECSNAPSTPLFPRELDQLLRDVAEKIKELKSRRDVSWDGQIRRELTQEEKEAIHALSLRQQELERRKFGFQIPPRSAAA